MNEPAPPPESASRRLRVALVAPYGEPRDGFFADSLLGMLAAEVEALGHEARVLRVYYDGHDAAADARVRSRFTDWLRDFDPDLIAFERLFDPVPIREFRVGRASATTALVWRGDSFDAVEGVDLAIGALPGLTRRGTTRRTPTIDELVLAFMRVVTNLAGNKPIEGIPGVARFGGDGLEGAALEKPTTPLPFRAIATQEVIAPDVAPRIIRKTIFGNAGCPYGDDPLLRPEFQQIRLPDDHPVSRLGCAFCFMGGDYEKRPDAEMVAHQVAQALFWTREIPELEELVLTDQSPVRYLAKLVDAAAKAGVRPVRWLFPARADSFLKEREKVREAAKVAASHGHTIELYLTGFESFSDAELGRYNKGLTAATALESIRAMRTLAAEEPIGFAYNRAQGHSLILWSPWTTLDDLQANVDALRNHGLAELFTDVGRNRLRLYKDLPIYWAAARDGLLTESWEDDDEGGARRKGYSVENPWKFRDSRTRLVFHLVRVLRDRLGPETELSQLAAAIEFARSAGEGAVEDPGATGRAIDAAVQRLEVALQTVLKRPNRAGSQSAMAVSLSGPCNNGCESCAQNDRWNGAPTVAIEAAQRPVLLAGREPTMSPILGELLRSASKYGPVAMVTNGRRFADPKFTKAAVGAGLRSVSVKLFGPDATTHDALARDPGAFEQTVRGVANMLELKRIAIEVRIPLHRSVLSLGTAFVTTVQRAGVTSIRLEVDLFALGLAHVDEAVRTIDAIGNACDLQGIALTCEPLKAGTVHPGRAPA